MIIKVKTTNIIKNMTLVSLVLIGFSLSQLQAEKRDQTLPDPKSTPLNAEIPEKEADTDKLAQSADIENTEVPKNDPTKTVKNTSAKKLKNTSKPKKNTLNLSELVDKVTHSTKSPDTEESEELPVAKERQVIGWVERVKIYPENIIFDAKLTPGSDGNVMHAEKIEPFKKGTEKWVSFETSDKFENVTKVERRVLSKTRFITANGKKESRYRVAIPICIAGQYLELEFALANRNIFRQPMRIGGDSLAGHFIIDPARTKTTKPSCNVTGAESTISK